MITNIPWSQPLFWEDEKWNGADHPVVGISWYEAFAFCRWLSEVSAAKISLPTEAQWQRAAQGDEIYPDKNMFSNGYPWDPVGRVYPWGNEWDGSRCNHNVDGQGIKQTTPVQQYEGKGDSPFGVVDLTGNVWEWCLTTWSSSTSYRGTNTIEGEQWRVMRGGSCLEGTYKFGSRWNFVEKSAMVTFMNHYRNSALSSYAPEDTGFRITYEEAQPAKPKPPAKHKTIESSVPAIKYLSDSPVKALLPAPFEWCEIPAGKVLLRKKNTRPKAKDAVQLNTFYIAKYPITNAQFKLFMDAGGYENSQWWSPEGWQTRTENMQWDYEARAFKATGIPWAEPMNWRDSKFNGADHPVSGISWYEAMAFCAWLSETSGEAVTLPTFQQWQRAAQGDDKRIYPWGSTWDSSRCNHSVDEERVHTGTTTPVQQYEGKGDSPFGVVDMTGNTYEWCMTIYSVSGTRIWRILAGRSWLGTGVTGFRVDKHFSGEIQTRGFMDGLRIVLANTPLQD